MNPLKKIAIILLFFLGLFWISSLVSGYVIIIPVSKYTEKLIEFKQSDTINPLASLDLSKGKWKAYLVLSKDDYNDLNSSLTRRTNVLKTSNIEVLKMMQKKWLFKYTSGDMATVESNFYLFNGEKLVFVSGIILDEQKVGLQNKEFGWLEPINRDEILNDFKEFKRVYWPIIFL